MIAKYANGINRKPNVNTIGVNMKIIFTKCMSLRIIKLISSSWILF